MDVDKESSHLDDSVTFTVTPRFSGHSSSRRPAQTEYDPTTKPEFFHLDSSYLAKCGLDTDNSLILYCRPTFHRQFRFLQDQVINKGQLGWIIGPPGTGKSTSSLAFASTLPKDDFVITWIHLDSSNHVYAMFVRFDSNSKTSFQITKDQIKYLLHEIGPERRHIVFLDGFQGNHSLHEHLFGECDAWRSVDHNLRKLVVVCSMTSRYKSKPELDMAKRMVEFLVPSWSKVEYLAAVQNDSFFTSISKSLDASADLTPVKQETQTMSKEELINSKFHFAGGSSRYMFFFTTKAVRNAFNEAIAAVDDIMPYLYATIGDKSKRVVNRLLGTKLVEEDDPSSRENWIVSEFAGILLASSCGSEIIRKLSRVIEPDTNPAAMGWLFEMWIFATCREKAITFRNVDGSETITLPQQRLLKSVDILTEYYLLPEKGGILIKPLKWNQGGYDAVYLDKSESLVRFFQITRADSHSFKIQYFEQFLRSLCFSKHSFIVKNLDIVFVVEESKLNDFKIKDVEGEGLLAEFEWPKMKEVDKVKIMCVDNFPGHPGGKVAPYSLLNLRIRSDSKNAPQHSSNTVKRGVHDALNCFSGMYLL